MTDDERAELERLRAEVASLKRTRVDGGLSRLAAHARSEPSVGQESRGGEVFDSAYDGALVVMKDMGLI